MLWFLLSVALIPCLIAADVQCPDGKVSCPEGKTCCTVNGQTACCDPDLEATLPLRAASMVDTYRNDTAIDPLHGSLYDGCSFLTCDGTCCNTGSMGCCPLKFATCCSNDRCCDMMDTCCGGGCCGFQAKCCGSWCCKSNQRCGTGYMTCFNAVAALTPTFATTIALLIATVMTTKSHFF